MRETLRAELLAAEAQIEDQLRASIEILARLEGTLAEPTKLRSQALAAAGRRLRRSCREIDLRLVTLTARQAPVACDLMLVIALMQIAHHQALIANQFTLISEQLAEIDPGVRDLCATGERVATLAEKAREQLEAAADSFAARDAVTADGLMRSDDELDQLNREICRASLQMRAGPGERALALRHVLIARSLERIGDNAVDIGALTGRLVRADVHHLAATPAAASG